MKLNEKVLDKIRTLYEIATEITKYWVHIELYRFDKYNKDTLKVDVYVFVDGKKASFFDEEIQLNEETVEAELQFVIDKMKELINPPLNEND